MDIGDDLQMRENTRRIARFGQMLFDMDRSMDTQFGTLQEELDRQAHQLAQIIAFLPRRQRRTCGARATSLATRCFAALACFRSNLDPVRPIVGSARAKPAVGPDPASNPAVFGQHIRFGPTSVSPFRPHVRFDRGWAVFDRMWARIRQLRSGSANRGQHCARFGQLLARRDRARARFDQSRARFGQHGVRCTPRTRTLTSGSANSLPGYTKIWPGSANFGSGQAILAPGST